jgi:hypothetical protein
MTGSTYPEHQRYQCSRPCRSGLPFLLAAPVQQSQDGLRDYRNIYVMNRVLEYMNIDGLGGRMERLTLVSQALSLSVIFYVVTYFLITWQWPQTLLSIFMCTLFLYLYLGERDHSYFVNSSLP